METIAPSDITGIAAAVAEEFGRESLKSEEFGRDSSKANRKRGTNFKIEFPGDESDKIVTMESFRAIKVYLKDIEGLGCCTNTEVLRCVFKYFIDHKVRPHNLSQRNSGREDMDQETEDSDSFFAPVSRVGKKLTNDVTKCVDDCLNGLVAVNTGMSLLEGHHVVIRCDIEDYKKAGKVAVLSGGGAGHEPAHAGYVGMGMLTGAVCGPVFTSPPQASILAAIRKVGKNNAGGVLLIVKNYTGDRINFGRAAEKAKHEGIQVEMVTVAEDCALTSDDKTAGRRGLCGTLLIHKIAGALAETGYRLNYISAVCKQAADDMGTIGLSLSPCSIPGSVPSFTLHGDEMELGLGIHGEAGVKRIKVVSARESVNMMVDHMTNPKSASYLSIPTGSSVALMVNNLGGTSHLELNIVADNAIEILESRGVKVARAYCGTFMTSLEMAGISLTVLILNDQRKQCLDFLATAPAWTRPMLRGGDLDRIPGPPMVCEIKTTKKAAKEAKQIKVKTELGAVLRKAVGDACKALCAQEEKLNQLDSQAGDADCGTTLKRGTEAILEQLSTLSAEDPHKLMLSLSGIAEKSMGGSSGAFYSLGFSAAARALVNDTSMKGWCGALRDAINAVSLYGGAQPGDRTMLDALHAACNILEGCTEVERPHPMQAFAKAVEAAEAGAQATINMKASAGRASYVNAEHLTQPDPGAYAVGVWMRAVYESMNPGARRHSGTSASLFQQGSDNQPAMASIDLVSSDDNQSDTTLS